MFHTGLSFFLKPKNAAKGITPVASGWDTPPSDLEKATDGDPDTVTGTGQTTTGAGADYGYIELDLGLDGVYLVGAKIGVWSDASYVRVYIESKPDGINWQPAQSWYIIGAFTTSEDIFNAGGVVISGRHIRFRFYVAAATTAYAKIYEIWAYKLD